MSCAIGIDPGLSGGLAFVHSGGVLATFVMPVLGKEIDFVKLTELLAGVPSLSHVFLERAQAFPKMGVCSAFNYGASYWGVRAICAALKLPYTLVAPVKWHKALVVGDAGEPKDRAARTCRQLFPAVTLTVGKGRKPHEGIVDALLIAEYGRRQLGGA